MSELPGSRALEGDAERLAQQRERARGCTGCSGCLGMFFSLRNWVIVAVLMMPGSSPEKAELMEAPLPSPIPMSSHAAIASAALAPKPYTGQEAGMFRPLIQRWVMYQGDFRDTMKDAGIPCLDGDLALGGAQIMDSWNSDAESTGIAQHGVPGETPVIVVQTGPGSGRFSGKTWYFSLNGDIFYQSVPGADTD